jgi:hypothetical protein
VFELSANGRDHDPVPSGCRLPGFAPGGKIVHAYP